MKLYQWGIVGVLAATLLWQGPTRLTEETENVLVTKTFVKGENYLVYTDKGTFKVSDSSVYFRFNSSDYWGRIKSNTKYQITHTGVRWPWMSWYENIVDFKEIK